MGIDHFGIIGLVIREGYTSSEIGESVTVNDGRLGVGDWKFVRLEIGDTCS